MIIKNAEPLDFSYLPKKLPFRENEIQKISETIIEPLKNGTCSNLMIYGDSGTGKTATIKYLIRAEKGVEIIYENALSYGNLKTLLLDVLQKLGKIVPNKGISYQQIFRNLKSISESKKKRIVLVIDEASNVMKGDYEGIYNLFRVHELYSAYISSIFVSVENPAIFINDRDRRTLGIFSSLMFPRYRREELLQIIGDRASSALHDKTFDPGILSYISDIAVQFGSARVAIELLQKAAYIAEYRKSHMIESEDVRAAKSLINPYITESKLGELDYDHLIVLLGICRCLSDSTDTQIPCISKEVRFITEQYEMDDIDSQKLYRIVKKLEILGLVDSRIAGMGDRKGVSKIIGISDVPVGVLSEKIEHILNHIV